MIRNSLRIVQCGCDPRIKCLVLLSAVRLVLRHPRVRHSPQLSDFRIKPNCSTHALCKCIGRMSLRHLQDEFGYICRWAARQGRDAPGECLLRCRGQARKLIEKPARIVGCDQSQVEEPEPSLAAQMSGDQDCQLPLSSLLTSIPR